MASEYMPAGAGFVADWATFQAQRQLRLQGRCFEAVMDPSGRRWVRVQWALHDGLSNALAWPFDLLRVQHALAMRSGLWPRSLLESQRFEVGVDALEKLSLGPLARSV